VSAELSAVAFEAQARLVAARTQRSKKLVLHVTNMEFIEGDVKDAPAP
jgi:hypothetical protein